MVGRGRLELPTSRLSGVRSNQAELPAPVASQAHQGRSRRKGQLRRHIETSYGFDNLQK